MRRVVAVIIAAVMTSLAIGVKEVAWAAESPDNQTREAQRAQVVRRLAGLRPGDPVSIELVSGGRIKAIINDIDADEITVMVEEPRRAGMPGRVVTQTLPVDAIKSIKVVRVSAMPRFLVGTAVAAGFLILLGVCAAASST